MRGSEPIALAHELDVGAELLAQDREVVHERDARREQGVRRVLGELGGAASIMRMRSLVRTNGA